MALSIITDKFRIENAKKFIQSVKIRPYPSDFSDSQDYERVASEPLETNLDALYMFIGKITTWYNEYNLPVGADSSETPVPDAEKHLRQESEVWANTLAAKQVERGNVRHVIPRENWTGSILYPYYRSDASNTTTFSNPNSPNFYVLDENEYRVYKCLFNNYESVSTERPSLVGGIGGDSRRFQIEPFETSDGYIWKYMYTIDPSEAINFVTDNYIPVRKDSVNDDGSTTDNSTIDGAIYRIHLPAKLNASATVAAPSTEPFARVRVEGIDSSTDISGDTLVIDMQNADNADRIGTSSDDDMVGYQVEHIVDDGVNKFIEIGRIDASIITETGGDRDQLQLTITRLDDVDAVGFSDASGSTETWFISPLIEIRGEGENASAMLYIDTEAGFDVSERKFYPEDAVTVDDAYDVVMNTVGSGYRNIYFRNDLDGTLNSYVTIKQGGVDIGSGVSEGAPTNIVDREITNFAEIVSVTPYGGHSSDNVSELYGYTIMINHTFSGDESGSATVANDFRQIALIQNPLEQDGSLADAAIYRQTIRLEFEGDVRSIIGYDDEISDKSDSNDIRRVFGRVVEWEYDSGADTTRVFLSSSAGFFDRTATEVYNLDDNHRLYLSYDYSSNDSPYTALTLTSRFTTPGSDGEYQKGLGSGTGNTGLTFMSGDMMYIENRQPIIRVADQSENIKLIIEY